MDATIAQALMTLALALIFGGFLVWAIWTGQFRDVEESNRRLFGSSEDDDSEGDKP